MKTPTDIAEQKIALLEKQLEKATAQLLELGRRISYLERENSRRRNETNHIAQAVRKG